MVSYGHGTCDVPSTNDGYRPRERRETHTCPVWGSSSTCTLPNRLLRTGLRLRGSDEQEVPHSVAYLLS